jgi:hypothetical protein
MGVDATVREGLAGRSEVDATIREGPAGRSEVDATVREGPGWAEVMIGNHDFSPSRGGNHGPKPCRPPLEGGNHGPKPFRPPFEGHFGRFRTVIVAQRGEAMRVPPWLGSVKRQNEGPHARMRPACEAGMVEPTTGVEPGNERLLDPNHVRSHPCALSFLTRSPPRMA